MSAILVLIAVKLIASFKGDARMPSKKEFKQLILDRKLNATTLQPYHDSVTEVIDEWWGETALHIAIRVGDQAQVQCLLAAVADETRANLIAQQSAYARFSDDAQRTALHLAIKYCDVELLMLLLESLQNYPDAFEQAFASDKKGYTPLNLVAKRYYYGQENPDKHKLLALINALSNLDAGETRQRIIEKAMHTNHKGKHALHYLCYVYDFEVFCTLAELVWGEHGANNISIDDRLLFGLLSEYSFRISKWHYAKWAALFLFGAGTTIGVTTAIILGPRSRSIISASCHCS